jgi:hypothetical protein
LTLTLFAPPLRPNITFSITSNIATHFSHPQLSLCYTVTVYNFVLHKTNFPPSSSFPWSTKVCFPIPLMKIEHPDASRPLSPMCPGCQANRNVYSTQSYTILHNFV